jgi:hypothetical protein
VAHALYALPPDRFVPERDALARELAGRGDPAAGAVRKLRRPVGLAWLLNHLAREEKGPVEALLAAGDRLRAAHAAAVAGRGGDPFRAAEEELRGTARTLRLAAPSALAAAHREVSQAALARLELFLRVLATAPGELREQFRAGLLEREPEVAAGELAGSPAAGGAPAASRPAPARPGLARPLASPVAAPSSAVGATVARAAGKRARAEAERQRRRADAERRRAEARARVLARQDARRRSEARRALAKAEAEVGKARAAVGGAEARAQEARAKLAAAEAEAGRLREALREMEEGGGGR